MPSRAAGAAALWCVANAFEFEVAIRPLATNLEPRERYFSLLRVGDVYALVSRSDGVGAHQHKALVRRPVTPTNVTAAPPRALPAHSKSFGANVGAVVLGGKLRVFGGEDHVDDPKTMLRGYGDGVRVRRADMSPTNRGDAAAATWIFL